MLKTRYLIILRVGSRIIIIHWGPGQFPNIAGNTGNHRNNRKIHNSDQKLNQTKRDTNKLCLGKISLQKTLRIKLSVDSGFWSVFYGRKWKLGNAGNEQKAF